jgi:hypothetical protein
MSQPVMAVALVMRVSLMAHPRFCSPTQRLVRRQSSMYQRPDCAAGVRFLAAVRERSGVKPSVRVAGVGKATGYRWLRESFPVLRESGCSIKDAWVGFVK